MFAKLTAYMYSRWCFIGSYIPNLMVDVIPELGIPEHEAYEFVSLLALRMLERARADRERIEQILHERIVQELQEVVKQKAIEIAA